MCLFVESVHQNVFFFFSFFSFFVCADVNSVGDKKMVVYLLTNSPFRQGINLRSSPW